ncbi:MAG: YceI family protein [Bacteroidales bacterium]|nr:YceI family protein [Bacteroidales bacterium]
MKLNSILLIVMLLIASASMGQKYVTKTGTIKFYSDAPLEKIEAINNQVNAALDTETGDLVFRVLMKSFIFEKALMQEHFNENYVESDIYPNATFLGKIINAGEIDFKKAGTYKTQVEGKLTLHGVTKSVKENGTLSVSDGKIMAISVFPILLSDYEVKIPGAIAGKISESIDITVEVTMSSVN